MSTAGAPAGDGNYPVSKEYGGHALLSDHTAYFMSSFTPQFNWFLARGYQDNSFYREMNTRWLKADKLFWSNTLTETSTIWGTPVRNRSWQLDKPTNLIVEILLYYYYIIISVLCQGVGCGGGAVSHRLLRGEDQQPGDGPHHLGRHHGRLPPQRRHPAAQGGDQPAAGVDVRAAGLSDNQMTRAANNPSVYTIRLGPSPGLKRLLTSTFRFKTLSKHYAKQEPRHDK